MDENKTSVTNDVTTDVSVTAADQAAKDTTAAVSNPVADTTSGLDSIDVSANTDTSTDLTPPKAESTDPVKAQTGTIVRTICLALALINQLLVANGIKALPISDDQVNTLVSTLITVAVSLWTWWKNNSFTKAAIKADQSLKAEKNG